MAPARLRDEREADRSPMNACFDFRNRPVSVSPRRERRNVYNCSRPLTWSILLVSREKKEKKKKPAKIREINISHKGFKSSAIVKKCIYL